MLLLIRLAFLRLLPMVFVVGLAACGGNSSSSPQPTPTPPPPSSGHLYVVNDGNGQILQFALPLTSTSTPSATVSNPALPTAMSVAADANGNVATADAAGHLAFYGAPITNSSTASATFSNGAATKNGQLAFDAAGDLFVATEGNQLNIFAHPFSSASTPSQVITASPAGFLDFVEVQGVTLDGGANLYVSDIGLSNGTATQVRTYSPPYTAAPSTAGTGGSGSTGIKMAATGAQLFIASNGEAGRGVQVFNLPLPSSVLLITDPDSPVGVAVDDSGNLYVANIRDKTIRVYAPPFSASSTPVVTLSLGSVSAFDIAIGK